MSFDVGNLALKSQTPKLESKPHHDFTDGPVGLWTNYVMSFDVGNLAWKSQITKFVL